MCRIACVRRLKSPFARRALLLVLITFGVLWIPHAGLAQVSIDPTAIPEKNDGGWVYWMAQGAIVLGGLILVVAVASYLRFAPRFFREREEEHEGQRAGVKAPPATAIRMQWRPPPPTPVAAPVGAAPPQTQAAAAPVAAPPAASPAQQAAPAPQPPPQEAEAPAQAPAPAASAGAPSQAAPAAPRQEGPIELDQETFDRVLKEQLDKGTDRRVAEGRARSAALKAAREKAGG